MLKNLLSAFRGLPRTVAARRPAYSAHDLDRITGDCFVVVCGNPFKDCDGETFIETVVAAMQSNTFGRKIRFTARSAADTHPEFRVTLLFNGAATVRAADLCAGNAVLETVEPSGDRGRVHMLAAWCRADEILSEVEGWIEGVKAPTDRRFARLVAQVTRDLFPPDIQPGGVKGN
jgi:hypothetical protein